jgi:neutral ceramidase
MSPRDAGTRQAPPAAGAIILGACLFLLPALAAPRLCAAQIQAGAAQVDITPPPGLPMYGYFNRITNHQVASGTLDPLYARILVLQAGEKRLALVTLDLGRTFNEPWLERLRAAAREGSHVDALIITASHTHSGPNILDVYPDGRPPAWEDEALGKIAAAIQKAALSLEPARLGTGHGIANIGYNRRTVNPDGTVSMLWSNPDKTPGGPVDSTVGVIRVDREDGTPIAILVNFACHPVILGSENLQYSADFIGPMASTVAAAFDGKPVCFYLQGAAGDINPYFAGTAADKDPAGKLDWTGRELGTEAARVAKTIQTKASADSSLDFADDVIVFPWRWDPQRFHDGLLRANGPLIFQDHAGVLAATPLPRELALHVTTLLIDRQIAFVGMPGEPFVHFQVDWRSRCPAKSCFFLGYANGYYDYFPNLVAATQGGYGAADSDTYVAVGAGERMLDHALVRVHEMLGELGKAPILEPYAPALH